jgi:hypothetical protein
VHREARFEFVARAPLDRVAPLFGADRERRWAPGWQPRFVHPLPASDRRGMVFTVSHGGHESIWVNTALDLAHGLVQYVYVVPGTMATLITVRLEAAGAQTRVSVEYQRTALSEAAGSHVRALSDEDERSGASWERQINEHLRSSR